jgi:hypothetical protein
MRPTYGVPQDDGSCQSHQCPPSHHKMALMPEYAQASARVPQPSQSSTVSPMSSAPVSPYHQQGSTMPLVAPAAYSSCHLVPFASMGGGSPHTRPHDCSYGLMAPSPATTEAAMPLPSSARPFLPTRSSPTNPLPTMGGSAALAACRALERSQQRLAFTMSKCTGFDDANPWVMETINAVALELQCWYR